MKTPVFFNDYFILVFFITTSKSVTNNQVVTK